MKKQLLILSILILINCEIRPSKIANPENLANNLVYFRHDVTGLCYSAVAISTSSSFSQEGIGLACVPCTEAVLNEIKKNNNKYGF